MMQPQARASGRWYRGGGLRIGVVAALVAAAGCRGETRHAEDGAMPGGDAAAPAPGGRADGALDLRDAIGDGPGPSGGRADGSDARAQPPDAPSSPSPPSGRDAGLDLRPPPPDGPSAADAPIDPDAGRRNLIAEGAEGTGVGRDSKTAGAVLETITDPVRAGRAAVRSRLPSPSEYRAELEYEKTDHGATYWLGFSMRPVRAAGGIIFGQLATYPEKEGRLTDRCGEVNGKLQSLYTGGNGHKLSFETRDGGVVIEYILRHKGALADVACEIYTLGALSEVQGRWVDFVLHARWTGAPDGFLKLWMKIEGGPWALKVDYAGATWWDDEGRGPYFKMGAYTGPKGAPELFPVEILTDEYRLGNERATFSDVSPDRTAPAGLR